jgi:hypothetical protein
MVSKLLLAATLALGVSYAAERPLSLNPENPHYFQFRGKPAVLLTSGEHYGAVLNEDFDYSRYLSTLARHGFNLTRTFAGSYVEVPGSFHIEGNTLAPKPGRYLAPWPRSGDKYDLSKWNEAFFARLKDFVAAASKRGIIVEVNLFTPFYEENLWEVSPMNVRNNVNGVGAVSRTEAFTLKDGALTDVQDRYVRKVVETLRSFDNIYFEVCNEPYFGGITEEWHRRMAKTITDAEAGLHIKHLIAWNVANGSKTIENPDPLISIFNFHYSFPAASVAQNYHLGRPIGNNETGFDGTGDAIYRVQAWDFLLAGGGLFNHLDYSYTVGHEDGSFGPLPATQPGGGSAALRAQLRTLHEFLTRLDFIRMTPAQTVLKSVTPAGSGVRVLAEPGRSYGIYVYHVERKSKDNDRGKFVVVSGEQRVALTLDLPPGKYLAEWVDPKTGGERGKEKFTHPGGERVFNTPSHSEDIALRITTGK